MCRLNSPRRLTIPIVLAGLAVPAALAITTQAQAVLSSQAPLAGAPQSAVALAQTPPPQFQPTPEEIGDSMIAHQRYQAAIEAYKKASRNSPDVWNKMGIAYQMMFNLQDATRCYQMSLKLDPKSAHVLNNLGTVFDSLKDYGAAERLYRKALKIDPKSALIHKNLGTTLLTQRKYNKGWEAYQAALALDPHIFENTSNPRVENPASAQQRGALNYYMARGCVLAGQNACAIQYLRMALNEGFTSPQKIVADNDFAILRGMPEFEQLLAAQRAQ
jgi:tetratricopeptide (TPR) repeat protein